MTFSIKHLSIGRKKKRKLLGRYRRILINNQKYIRTVNVLGWILFGLSSFLYMSTMYPTVTFWDSGEFIVGAKSLQLGHQPGAPLYQLIGAIISLFSFGNMRVATILINLLSALAAGLSVMLLFHIFLYLFNKYSEMYIGNMIAAFIASSIFALTDSFWTSATEAEVYTMSFLFTVLCIRTILHWDEKPSPRWIILLCFILGLSFGIHPLTLLVIPAVVFIIYFHYKKITFKDFLLACLISVVVLILAMNIFTWLLDLLNFSVLLFILLLLVLAGLMFFSYIRKAALLNGVLFGLIFFLLGCSSYLIIGIRGSEPLPMNQSQVNSAKTLKEYISRDAFVHAPVVYGAYYTDWPPKDFELEGKSLKPVFDKELQTFFPRMWNYTSENYANNYVSWVGQPEDEVIINGNSIEKPSFLQNVSYFLKYQVGYMYLRYLVWNFSGRTSDVQGDGSLTNGQGQSGLYIIDQLYKVDEGETTDSLNNKANNRYFAIPLFLCIVGLFYHMAKDPKRFWFVMAIFIMYSLALVVYLNSAAYEVRERDYVYLPSFMAVSIWIGIGVLGISQIIANIIRVRKPRYILPLFLVIPVWMGIENYADHNHRHQYTAYNFAASMLKSCDKDAILIVDGDNDTYPLWYCQNVEHIREDVRVINRELLNNASTISLIGKPAPNCKKVNLLAKPKQYKDGVMASVSIIPSFSVMDMREALLSLYQSKGDEEKFKDYFKTLHTNNFLIKREGGEIELSLDMISLPKGDVMILDILASNPDRPVYFSSYSNTDYLGLDDYLLLEGFAYRVSPQKVSSKGEIVALSAGVIDEEKMYDNLMHNFHFKNFDKDIYFNETERSIVSFYIEKMRALAYKLLELGQNEKALAVINKCVEYFPVSIHSYPNYLADIALMYSVLGYDNLAEKYMLIALSDFQTTMQRYHQGTIRFQSENRLEIARQVNYYLDLCILAEQWGEEKMRISLAESFFSIIRPYLEISYRQKKMMQLQGEDYYAYEIEQMDDMINNIREFAMHYEEALPTENDYNY